MVEDAERPVLRRFLPLLLAVLIAVTGGAGTPASGAGRPAAVAAGHAASDEPAGDTEPAEAVAAVVVTGRERVLTEQITAAVRVSRAPPASLA
ncbi:hypothetical protein [Actinoplanes teichomyceticus]|uniref:Uncharacterized protein n=1 Tax=Actinoplanes teichomyceticus TaxID=1867 RepID=A0A561VIB5_ACTTI|nr:hypothetical protein [Actinoplanes teichomyceticus]TWG11351.1 hypothetical protein FHX34_10681 [Actinoplanes teichomyceticus]GIF15833.1 hypothetical protein Ate01nite_58650 [Actinoplanes teichomyceticus]